MSTHSENIARIRRLVGEPDADAPSDPIVFENYASAMEHHLRQIESTNANLDVNTTNATFSIDQEEAALSIPGTARVFWVRSLETDPRRNMPIPLVLLQGAPQGRDGIQMSVYVRDNGVYAALSPLPTEEKTYTFFYEKGALTESIEATDGMAAFHHLVRAEAAFAILPDCDWSKWTQPRQEAYRTAKGTVLMGQIAAYQRQFRAAAGSATDQGQGERSGFGDDSLSAGGYMAW